MISIFTQAFDKSKELIEARFDIDCNIPLAYDLEIGDNWMEKERVKNA
jgi:hypothetical protein